MNFSGILILSFGIAMDAFAVAITSGSVLKERFRLNNILKIGLFLTFFQAFMPLVGWGFGSQFSFYIKNVDHWIAFFLLGIIGVKMVIDSINSQEDEGSPINPLNNKVLIYLSLATSIDALAVGVGFAFLNVSILFSIICIGITTFLLSIIGIFIGKLSGERLKKKAGIFGGFVLILIGLKILLEHLGIIFN
ncbi:manganese efflux pump MntP family protein [Bacillus sp. 31A1R]|uniref:Putative manganese efflux pump MntP n=1 Tax=Robertmurraya mangrovi TaxID=3098077 RepID=A0ABU5IZ27_9BACI|nr:manganese efflux pump MntP family protein [Bacillus sp. 31A1R]MDZ5472382.1 manganese efflux pump MntP family protein [Bacillus sp. 31A1R]